MNWRIIWRNSTAKPRNLNELKKHKKRYAQTGYANEFWIIENKVWNKNSQYTRNNKGFFYHTWKKEADSIIFFKNMRKTFGW